MKDILEEITEVETENKKVNNGSVAKHVARTIQLAIVCFTLLVIVIGLFSDTASEAPIAEHPYTEVCTEGSRLVDVIVDVDKEVAIYAVCDTTTGIEHIVSVTH